MAKGYKSWRIPGHGHISEQQILVLEYMVARDDEYGGAWCDLQQFHIITIQSLLRHDRIQLSKRPDNGVDYKIHIARA